MRKALLAAMLFASSIAFSQPVGVALMRVTVAPTGICQAGDPPEWVVGTGDIWTCRSIAHGQGTWTASPIAASYLPLSGGALSGALALAAEFSNGTCTTAKTISAANGNSQKVTLTAADACALTFTQPASGTITITLKVIQSALTTTDGTITGGKWPGGTVPTITATAGAIDILKCYLDGTNAYCTAAQNFQ